MKKRLENRSKKINLAILAFTLVELIAVIVILGILLVIAVPRITDIIANIRINAYVSNESLLINATKKYITINDQKLPNEVGETIEISINKLQDANLIGKIKDINNKNECVNSKVTIIKTEEGYKYEAGLVCDNYISLYKFDILEGIGSFEKDSNGNGIADSWNSYIWPTDEGSFERSVYNNMQSVTRLDGVTSSAYKYIAKTIYSPIQENKYYAYVEFYNLSNLNYRLELCLDNYNPNYTNATANNDTTNTSGYLSIIHTTREDTTRITLFLRLMAKSSNAGDATVNWKNAVLINLTEIYGEGNEPTKEIMDYIIKQII